MSWASRFRRRERIRTSFWMIPAAYVVVALVLADQLPALDARADLQRFPVAIDPSSARDTLSAISSGMIAPGNATASRMGSIGSSSGIWGRSASTSVSASLRDTKTTGASV